MAAYNWQRWLVDELQREGCDVRVVDGWKDRGRYRADGNRDGAPDWDFMPDLGFVWHHTGTTTSQSDPWRTGDLLVRGRSDLPGPLCQISPDYHGVVHVIAAGRANHAGLTNGFSHLPPGSDGNSLTIGCEIDYNGTQEMPHDQYVASIKAAAAYCRYKRRDHTYAYGHHETSTTGKWDPGDGGVKANLDAWREDLRDCLSYPVGVWGSTPRASWGVVRVAHLREGRTDQSESVRKLQYRLKTHGQIPQRLQDPIRLNGVYNDATREAVEWWQENVFSGTREIWAGRNLTNVQANELFGNRYKVIEE